jgi:mitogen-activated protein kinase kinase kinase
LDPDSNYYQRLAHLDDSGSEDESDDGNLHLDGLPLPLGLSHTIAAGLDPSAQLDKSTLSPSIFAIEAETKEGHERLEWQSMLASVLAGDVLQGESTRQGLNEPTKGGKQKALGQSLWWQIRARMRGRTEAEEKRRVEERRGRIVDSVLEEMDDFKVKKVSGKMAGIARHLSSENAVQDQDQEAEQIEPTAEEAEHEEELSALDQVNYMLEKLSLVEALYPHHTALRQVKPLYDSEKFQSRVNALGAWSTIVQQLQTQLQILQKWTGSDDIDITRPNTTKEKALVSKNRYHPLDTKAKAQSSLDLAADDTTFLERVMKEDNLQRTFEKRIFVDIMSLVINAKDTVISWLPAFEELGLPDFQYELVRLIGFPGRLITEALKVRLDAAAKLVDPNPIVVNDMIDNFRLSISLAVLIKRQYDDIVSPDPEKRWQIPPCMAPDYDAVLLDALRTFFKLLHWKLKGGNRASYFKETEVLEDEWEFLYEAAEAVEGGDLVVAESFCSLTNKLMVRVSNFFETQLGVPIPIVSDENAKKKADLTQRELSELQPDMGARKTEKREMTSEEMLVWYGKILEAVKMRYRKLQRFAWYVSSIDWS